MAENDTAGSQETQEKPILRMQKMYIKDFSFENPNSPEIFRDNHKSEPNVQLNLQLNNRNLPLTLKPKNNSDLAKYKSPSWKGLGIIRYQNSSSSQSSSSSRSSSSSS